AAAPPPPRQRWRPPPPPIWMGGNPTTARQRVAQYGDGWCPFPAPPQLAQTAGTAAITSPEDLSTAIDDLRRRCDAVGKDWSALDITFTNFEGGSPTGDDFNADAYLGGLEKLAAVGVTWVSVHLPGDSVAHALDTLERFRTEVIDAI